MRVALPIQSRFVARVAHRRNEIEESVRCGKTSHHFGETQGRRQIGIDQRRRLLVSVDRQFIRDDDVKVFYSAGSAARRSLLQPLPPEAKRRFREIAASRII
jgi:hypothetical protein